MRVWGEGPQGCLASSRSHDRPFSAQVRGRLHDHRENEDQLQREGRGSLFQQELPPSCAEGTPGDRSQRCYSYRRLCVGRSATTPRCSSS